MPGRNLIIYPRITDAEAKLVDINNYVISQTLYPVIIYSERPILKVRPLKSNGIPYSLADFSSYATWEFGIDTDWNKDTAPVVHAVDGFNVQEVTENGIVFAEISVQLNGFTTPLKTVLENNNKIFNGVTAELSGFEPGQTEPGLIIQFPFILKNKLLDIGSAPPDEPLINWYTRVQIDSLFASTASKEDINIAVETHETTYNHTDISANKADILLKANQIDLDTTNQNINALADNFTNRTHAELPDVGLKTHEQLETDLNSMMSSISNNTQQGNTNKDDITGIKTKTDLLSVTSTTDLDNLSVNSHTHTNKSVLDNTEESYTTSEKQKLANLPETITEHNHANKDILDNITASFTSEEKTKLAALDPTTAEHSHLNKTVLDAIEEPYTAAEKTKLTALASTKQHEHANKTTLDAIEQPFTTELKTKLDGIEDGATATGGGGGITKVVIDADTTLEAENKYINEKADKCILTLPSAAEKYSEIIISNMSDSVIDINSNATVLSQRIIDQTAESESSSSSSIRLVTLSSKYEDYHLTALNDTSWFLRNYQNAYTINKAYQPPDTTIAWFRPEDLTTDQGAAFETWINAKGGGYDLANTDTNTQPLVGNSLLNGHKYVSFVPTQFLSTTSILNLCDYTMFIVLNRNFNDQSTIPGGTNSWGYDMPFVRQTLAGERKFWFGMENNSRPSYANRVHFYSPTEQYYDYQPTGTWNLFTITHAQNGNTSIYLDGILKGSLYAGNPKHGDSFLLGGATDGMVAELIICLSALDLTTIQDTEAHLIEKFALS